MVLAKILAQILGARRLTNAAGAVTDIYEYDAFGNKVNSTGTTPNEYFYRGEQWDPDLGLYYLRARYYNPLTGRFLSVDALAGGQRRYEYAAANPVDGMDPSGNEAIVEWALLQFYPGRLPFIHATFPGWCGLAGGGYLAGCGSGSGGGGGVSGGTGAGPGAPGGPPPTCKTKADLSKQYVLTVTYDSGGTSKEMNDKVGNPSGAWDARGITYSLEIAPNRPGTIGTAASFCKCAITEHQSSKQLTVGDGTEYNTGLFQDAIGPHGERKSGVTHSSRTFTVVLDGANLGQVKINDRSGEHDVDDIKITDWADTTELNHTLNPTDVP
jgi:RHS repeat-associated protein